MARHRGITPAEVRSRYGDGKIYIGHDALAHGLVDEVGTYKQALAGLGVSSSGSIGASMPRLRFKLGMGTVERLANQGFIPWSAAGSREQAEAAVIERYQRERRPLPDCLASLLNHAGVYETFRV